MEPDKIRITITETGQLKIQTDAVSMPNHANADDAIRLLIQLAGGPTATQSQAHEHLEHQQAHSHHHHLHHPR
jgi:hypothetical protein